MIKKLLAALGIALVALIAIVLVRTFATAGRQLQPQAAAQAPDAAALNAAADRLAQAVRIRTISYDGRQPDLPTFAQLHKLLAQFYPRVHKTLRREVVNGGALLYTWPGTDSTLAPLVLLAHQDVVPVEAAAESKWTHPPFSGHIADGYIYGRGTLDDKVNVLAQLEAVEQLLAAGYAPKRTILLAYGHDEEINGALGAQAIVKLLAARNIKPYMVLDEGMPIADGLVPGVSKPVALIGTAEKGILSVELKVDMAGGHSSIPEKEMATTVLAQGLARLQAHPFPASFSAPVQGFIQYLAPEMSLTLRMALSNLWLFRGIVEGEYEKSPSSAALLHTTMAVTVLQAGEKENVIPTQARAIVNLRLLPGQSIEAAAAHIRQAVADARITVTPLTQFAQEASPPSPYNCEQFGHLQTAIAQTFPNTLVAPTLMLGAADARHYAAICPHVYRFSPAIFKPGDPERLHGINERVAVANYGQFILFYDQLIKQF
jgi:carboxypeptidase PM20D1